MTESVIKDKSYGFALRIITLARWLRVRKEYDLASHVLRAGIGKLLSLRCRGNRRKSHLEGLACAFFGHKLSRV